MLPIVCDNGFSDTLHPCLLGHHHNVINIELPHLNIEIPAHHE